MPVQNRDIFYGKIGDPLIFAPRVYKRVKQNTNADALSRIYVFKLAQVPELAFIRILCFAKQSEKLK